MPWLMFVFAVLCIAVAFRTHSVGLALLSLLAALGLMLWGALSLAAARLRTTARDESQMIPPEQLRQIAESIRQKKATEAAASAEANAGDESPNAS